MKWEEVRFWLLMAACIAAAAVANMYGPCSKPITEAPAWCLQRVAR